MKGTRTLAAEPFIICRRRPHWARDGSFGKASEDRVSWRWISYRSAAGRLAKWRRLLRDVPRGSRVAVLGSPSVEALVADLAVRSLGLVAVHPDPAAAGGRPAAAPESVIEEVSLVADAGSYGTAGDFDRQFAGVDRRRLADIPDSGVSSAEPLADDPGSTAGGCLVRNADGTALEMSAEELGTECDRIAPLLGKGSRRQSLIHGRSLGGTAERVLVEWAIRSASVLIIPGDGEPSSEAICTAAFELRPSVLHGRSRELAAWMTSIHRAEGGARGVRRRLRRLEWVVVTGRNDLDGKTASLLTGLGAALLFFEQLRLIDRDRL